MIKSGTFFVQLYDVAIIMIRSCNFSINQYAVTKDFLEMDTELN